MIILLMMIPLFSFSGCVNNVKVAKSGKLLGSVMINQIDTIMPDSLLNKFCKVESIPNDMYKWTKTPFSDENGKDVTKYLYIKKMDSVQTIYTIINDDDESRVHFIKRITKK